MTDHLINVAEGLIWLPRLLLIVACLIIIGYASDRDPPYKLLSSEPIETKPGQYAHIVSKVWRDKSRDCSASISRFLVMSDGSRMDLTFTTASDKMIDELEATSPGKGDVRVYIPDQAIPGPAKLQSVLLYRCNFVHSLWPIEITISRPMTILPL